VGVPGGGAQQLPGHAGGAVLALAPLLHDDVAFPVEASEGGMLDPLALHQHPDLERVRGDVRFVLGEVGGGPGVEVVRVRVVDAGELVRDGHFGLPGDQPLQLGAQRPDAQRVGALMPGHLLAEHRAGRAQALRDGRLPLRVARADHVGPLEGHVLEDVRDPGDAGRRVDVADAEADPSGDGRHVVAGEQQEEHAVVEPELLHPLEDGGAERRSDGIGRADGERR